MPEVLPQEHQHLLNTSQDLLTECTIVFFLDIYNWLFQAFYKEDSFW